MGVCIKLATRSLRKNKGRTLITLMGIVLSVLMVCTIFTLLNSMLDSAIDSIIEKDEIGILPCITPPQNK